MEQSQYDNTCVCTSKVHVNLFLENKNAKKSMNLDLMIRVESSTRTTDQGDKSLMVNEAKWLCMHGHFIKVYSYHRMMNFELIVNYTLYRIKTES